MDDIKKGLTLRADLNRQVSTIPQRGHLTYGDSAADRITVEVYRGNTPVTIDGIGAGAVFYAPPSRAEINLEASVSGNTVSTVLDEHCYAEEGYYELEIYLRGTDGTRVTIMSISGNIHRAGSGVIIDAAGTIPSIDDLLAMIDDIGAAKQAAYDAAENANTAANLVRSATASATTLATGAQATATVTEVDGHWVFHFGLPRGPAGQIDNVTIDSIPGLSDELARIEGLVGSGSVDLQTVYPVGSIYMNASDATSPAQIIGGDWEKLSSRFLIASHDANYPAGTSLGSEFRTLTIRHMPPHTHGLKIQSGKVAEGTKYARLDSDDSTSTVSSSLVTSTGGEDGAAQPFSVVPPYFAVHMWRRVA